MKIHCISDLHGFLPDLEGGDLLIVAGDLTATHTEAEHHKFNDWIQNQDYEKIIVIAGNHDTWIEENGDTLGIPDFDGQKVEYLSDSGTEFEGLKIWGSPWTMKFDGINPKCCAYTVKRVYFEEDLLDKKWQKIPDDTDILITHCPPYGILDYVKSGERRLSSDFKGSESLRNHSMSIKPKLHVFGHIHEQGGKIMDACTTMYVNASIMNEKYEPVNKPIKINLERLTRPKNPVLDDPCWGWCSTNNE